MVFTTRASSGLFHKSESRSIKVNKLMPGQTIGIVSELAAVITTANIMCGLQQVTSGGSSSKVERRRPTAPPKNAWRSRGFRGLSRIRRLPSARA